MSTKQIVVLDKDLPLEPPAPDLPAVVTVQNVTREIQIHPAAAYRVATDVAGLCKEIVLKTAVNIQGKKYVRAEGWQAIATAHGCAASVVLVEKIEGGIRAVAEIRKISDGICIATAEGFVGDDEPMWQKRPMYARRAMASTRSISRACRSAFAHVVVLMDAGLSTTPAEEVPDGGFDDKSIHEPKHERDARDDVREQGEHFHEAQTDGEEFPANPLDESDSLPTQRKEDAQFEGDWRNIVVHFGASKGTKLGDMENKTLYGWAAKWQPKIFRGKINDDDNALRSALDAAAKELNFKFSH